MGLVLLSLLALSCSGPADGPAEGQATSEQADESVSLTIYSGRSESLVGPLFEAVESELGFELDVQYGDTPDLVTRMLTEGAESPADLLFAQDSGHLGAVGARGAFETLPGELTDKVDPHYRDPDGQWVGTSGRLRVLVVNTAKVPEDARPTSLRELAEPAWQGRLGWAPTNGSLQTHVSALRAVWGEDDTRTWLQGVKANAPTAYPKNSPQVEAAHAGEIEVGWVNHYYLHRLQTDGYQATNHSFAAGDAGNLLMVSGVGLRAGTPHREEALQVVDWLLGEEAQAAFATDNFEYPTVPGTPLHPDVPPLDPTTLVDVPQSALADLGPSRALLQELGLL